MALIHIREQAATVDSFTATVSFEDETEYTITIRDPFSQADEQLLEWYFEDYLTFPFLEQVRAQQATASIIVYGEQLFKQVFADPDAYARYKDHLQAGLQKVQVQIAGEPRFQALHWEALKDPKLPQPLSLQATIVRKNLTPQVIRAQARSSPMIHLLLVTARPFGSRDIGYRTISRPLVDGLRQAGVLVQVDILRPGTYRALVARLEEVKHRHAIDQEEAGGYYHVIHFDVHGAMLTHAQLLEGQKANRYLFGSRYGRTDIAPFEGQKAFLFLEGEQDGQADLVEAGEMANLLITHRIPIAIINACQSGKQADKEIDARETSLGSRLMQAGVQVSLAMGYSVTVSAVELFMRNFYQYLFAQRDLSTAILRARQELFHDKRRRAYFNQMIELEDWLLPVVYQNQVPVLRIRNFTPEEGKAFYETLSKAFIAKEPSYGFFGRDWDILQLEKRLLIKCNLVLVRGMGGAGKTTLLQHLGAWWQRTGFVSQVFYFGYDEKAWSRQQLLDSIAKRLLSPVQYLETFQLLTLEAQQAFITQRLRAERHLVILDNLESITGVMLSIQHILPPEEQQGLQHLLADLVGGRTLILLGSRSGEDWLAERTFGDNVFDLGGLDSEAASLLADRILEQYQVTQYRQDPALGHLLSLLDGFPLAIEVVLANLARKTPTEVLETLQEGDVQLNTGKTQERTENILRCVDYSYSNLDVEAQQLLLCLALFTSVFDSALLEEYTKHLKQQPILATLPFARWQVILQQAMNWGLLSPDPINPRFLHLQPILPYFLRLRLNAPDQTEFRSAVERAFRDHYDSLGFSIDSLLTSKDPQKRPVGRLLVQLEYENLVTALKLAVEVQDWVAGSYSVLVDYFYAAHQQSRGLELFQSFLARFERFPPEVLFGALGKEYVYLIGTVANWQNNLGLFEEAKALYHKILEVVIRFEDSDELEKIRIKGGAYYQLGRVAEEQKQWQQAEQYFQQALPLYIETKDRSRQANTYHQLGILAGVQRQWQQAVHYYQRSLEIRVESNDRYEQAQTYQGLGFVAEEQRQWQQAVHYYQRSLEIYIEFDDRYGLASVYHSLGFVAERQGQWQQARHYYQRSLEIYIEFDDRHEQAKIYQGLGDLAMDMRLWEQAVHYYQRSLEIYIEFDDRHEQAKIYHQLGRVAEEQKQWQQARKYFLQALEMVSTPQDEDQNKVILFSLARLRMATDDESLAISVAAIIDKTPSEVETMLREMLKKMSGKKGD